MRIAATADIHFTPQNYNRIRDPLARVRDEADLLVIAGDLTNYGKPEEMHSLLNALVRLRVPIVAVLGNYDYESCQEQELIRMMTAEGIKVLDGSSYERAGIGFARHRLVIDIPAPGGTYTVTTPFGVQVFPDVTPGKRAIFFTNDIGLVPGDFSGALKGQITTFLRASSTAGGDPLPPIAIDGDTFIADPANTTALTGSPFGTNFFRIEGPNIGGTGIDVVETDQFTLMGKVHTAPIPSPVTITRATYRRSGSSVQADVFATAKPSIGAPDPVLSITGTGIRGTLMTRSGDHYYAQPSFQSQTVPASITITNSTDSPTSTAEAALVDEVHITSATYDPSSQKLTIHAASGDEVNPPELLAEGLGKLTASGDLEVSLPIPPQEVIVISTRGGRDTRPVDVGTAGNNGAPVANNDELAQDLPADVASNVDILANDQPSTGVTPRTLANPQHGTVRIDAATNQAVYTPAVGFSGPDRLQLHQHRRKWDRLERCAGHSMLRS